MENTNSKWQGLRAIVIARQSDDKDGTASTKAQLSYMGVEFDRVGLKFVDKIVLEGLSASAPAKISEVVEKLFQRKLEKNDFDVIAWQVEDRASRSGGEHGMWLQHEANRHGLLVFFGGEEQIEGPFASMVRVAKFEAARDSSVGTGRHSAQGQTWAQKEGFFRTAGHTPIGCDRVYLDVDNKQKYILHNLANGLQEQLDYATRKKIGTFGSVGKKSYNRFKKQANEYSLLMPGDREQQRTVRVIFYLRYKRGWRGCRIADFLNRNAVPSPKGKEWSQRQVQVIYENEAYTGCTYNNQTYSGRFFRRDRSAGFVPLNRGVCELVMKKTFSPKIRPMDDWERIDQPYMYDFLPRDVRDLAITAQAQNAFHQADPNRTPRKPTAHPASSFLLSKFLRDDTAKKETLFGTMSGNCDNKTAYYRHPRSKRGRRKGSAFNHLIPAEPLHHAIVQVLGDILANVPDLENRLRQHVIKGRKTAETDTPDVRTLEEERDDVQQQIDIVISTLKGAALAAVGPQLERLGARRNSIDQQLKSVQSAQTTDHRPIETVVAEAIKVLNEDRKRLLTLPMEPLRDLVKRFITDAVVNMQTKSVELNIALPTWALVPQSVKNGKKGTKGQSKEESVMCPPVGLRSPVGSWTHEQFALFRCDYKRTCASTTAPACYKCRRLAA